MPALSGLTPNSVIAGNSPLTLTVSGSNFVQASAVEWNGAALATSYISSTSLTAQVPPADLYAAGTVTIGVQSPAPGGGVSGLLNFTINIPPNPTPTVTLLSPSSTTVGSPTFALVVTGTQFIPTSNILWDGNPLPTTYVSSTSLTAQVPASDLISEGTATVVVQNPAPGGGESNSQAFALKEASTNLTVLDIEGNDLAWNASQKKLYVAVPSTANTNASTVTIVDPIAGSIITAQQLTTAPSGLAISDDNQYLYAVINGGATIQRLILPALTPDIQWSLGTDSLSGNPNVAGDIKVQPNASHTLAVSLGQYGVGSVAVFDDAVKRSLVASEIAPPLGNSLQWKADGSALYDTPTFSNDSPYNTATSDQSLYTMPVNSSGVGAVTTYGRSFRVEGAHLHFDRLTGYLYSDWGEVINPANGFRIGNYRNRHPSTTVFPGPLSVVDSSLNLFYTLTGVNKPDGTQAFQLQVFDQTHFQLLHTMIIPNVVGQPANFIRWGQSGLAFVTNSTSSGTPGKLYILDGGFVNPSGVQDSSAGTQLASTPTLTAISPITATVGSGSLTMTITGRDFVGQPTAYWNGSELPTTLVNNTEISVQVPASDLSYIAQAAITVSNNGSSLTASNSMPFSINGATPSGNTISVYNTGGDDLVWDANAGKIYVSMPGIQGDSGDALGIVDPVSGAITTSGFLGSDPDKLSLSDNGQYLYVALDGENAIQQLTMPDFQVNNRWNLGGVGTSDGAYYALDLQVEPTAPQTTAVISAAFDRSPSPIVLTIYDGSTPRPSPLQTTQYPYSSLQWAGTASKLYTVDQFVPQDFMVLGVGPSGASLDQFYQSAVNPYSDTIHYDAGTSLIYTDGGQAIQPLNSSISGNYGSSGIAVPDAALDRVFILGQTAIQLNTSNYTIESFDQAKFTALSSITIDNVVGAPTALIRWGSNGLAFTTHIEKPEDFYEIGPGQLYVISGDFVKPSNSTGQISSPTPIPPVVRTWNVGGSSTPRSRSVVVKSSQ